MPTSVNAAKRMRQNEKHRLRNRKIKSSLRTEIRRYLEEVHNKNAEAASAQYKIVSGLLDKAAGKGVIHKNFAARKKSRLQKKLNHLEG